MEGRTALLRPSAGPCLHPAQPARAVRCKPQQHSRRRLPTVRAEYGDGRPFDEGEAQVRRLLARDRKELTGLEEIGANLRAEFDEEDTSVPERPWQEDEYGGRARTASPASSSNGASTSSPFGGSSSGSGSNGAAKPASPFGAASSSPVSSPFGSSSAARSPAGPANPFGSSPGSAKPRIEPRGLTPDMAPDAPTKEAWWTRISMGQIVIVASFTTIISLSVATFFLVVRMGGVHFNE